VCGVVSASNRRLFMSLFSGLLYLFICDQLSGIFSGTALPSCMSRVEYGVKVSN